MCQIDSLQRLKYERKIIQKALKNLPKTLNETYDRIFRAVPEEERLFVKYALRWIAYHNKLYGHGMPYEVLIQATEAIILSLTGNQNERFYDKDTLREVCGCLINMAPEDFVDGSGDYHHTYTSVSFAHYSVREYLDSTRNSNAIFGYPTVDGGDLEDRFREIILLGAQHIESDELWDLETNLTGNLDVVQAVDSRFDIYCVVSALLFLHKFPSQICRHSTLSALAIDLLDPSKPHFPTMKAAAFAIDQATPSFRIHEIWSETCFWTAEWHPDTSAEIQHLYNLLVLTESCDEECLPFAEIFLQGKDLRSLLQAQVSLKREVLLIYSDFDARKYEFKVSLVEVFAQLAVWSVTAFKFLVEVGARLFDPSPALLHYINAHGHLEPSSCKVFCPLQRLLELGADPNLRGYRTTPLQIVTYCSDYEGVEMLLKAGALPNETGSADGVIWPEDSVSHSLNQLHGLSPLLICRTFVENREHNVRKEIEALLLYHGAEALSTISEDDIEE